MEIETLATRVGCEVQIVREVEGDERHAIGAGDLLAGTQPGGTTGIGRCDQGLEDNAGHVAGRDKDANEHQYAEGWYGYNYFVAVNR